MTRLRSRQAETEDVVPRRLKRGAVKRQHIDRWAVGHTELAPGVVGDTHLHPTAIERIREVAADGLGLGATVTLTKATQSIASGGAAVEWEAFKAGPVGAGFDSLVLPSSSLTVPTWAYWRLHVRFAWDTWRAAGTVTAKVDGVTVDSVIGTFGSRFSAVFALGVCTVDQVVTVEVDHGDTSSHDLVNAQATLELVERPGTASVTQLDQFWMDSRLHSMHASVLTYAESNIVLAAGVTYRVTVEGNWTRWNTSPLPYGESGVPIMFLSPAQAQRDSGMDAEVGYATEIAGTPPTHSPVLEMNTGSGWGHVEPVGAPFATRQSDHLYTYLIAGEGSTLKVAETDGAITDNNGMLRITVYSMPTGGGS